ncbi:hypothetical protein [Pseudomonas viridiflava]|uniref:hypothetical protein n=1 Tax=Pseudomonas viridiflava TaxID=33069 RepID=UPI000F029B2F|nr:hypothetical protein [Pseudomonas viridiflava]
MKQGKLSIECYNSLSSQELLSLSKIRNHYGNKQIFALSIEETLMIVDRAYEAMGRCFRSRIIRETIKFGRYCGDLDGVFLIISDALRAYDSAGCFHLTAAEAKTMHERHKNDVHQARKKINAGFNDIVNIINETLPSVWHRYSREQMHTSLNTLSEIQTLLDGHFDLIDFESRSYTSAESFVHGVCMSLVWNANIRPTKPMTDSAEKTPLLRFLEVFYPSEANSILSRVYDRERKLPQSKRIGATFIPPL